MTGLLHIYCGDGKGKTTAAIGSAIRNVGAGGKVVFAQFMKDASSSELNILKNIDGISLFNCQENLGFSWNMTPEVKAKASEIYTRLFDEALFMAHHCDMLVLDELCSAVSEKFIDVNYVVSKLKQRPSQLEIIITGRNPDNLLIEIADYISEIQHIRHPFEKGINARKGIEF